MKINVVIRISIISVLLFFKSLAFGQDLFPEHLKKTLIAQMKDGDSLLYYQCHVEEVTQQLSTASGQTLTTKPEKISITEKFIIYKNGNGYKARYFVSSLTILPNRKFSGLKIREKSYWNFKFLKEEILSDMELKVFAATEIKGREPNEYDFVISKHTTNQIIIKQKKNFKQRVMDTDLILSKIVFN